MSANELDLWIRAGRTDSEILADVRQRGLLEPVGSDVERRLRADGASSGLLSQLTTGSKDFVVSAEAAARARDEIAVQAEKDKANRALALQRLRATQPTQSSPNGAAPSSGKKTPVLEVEAIAEPPGSGADGWKVGFVNARKQALAEKKLVLVDFTGSDWCGWCQKLEKEVFATPQFKEYAAKKLVLVRADYPRRTPQPPEVKAQNAKLAEAFGITGYPTIFVLNSEGKPVGKLGYMEGGPAKFIAELATS